MIDHTGSDADKEPRRIPGDIEVEGVLRIADDTICEGNLIAPGGVVLGARVTVQGDVYTDGPVEMGPDARIEGRVCPAESAKTSASEPETSTFDPASLIAPPTGDPQQGDSDDEAPERRLESKALASTLDILLTLSLQPGNEQRELGLRDDALADLLEGVYQLVVDLYRDGDPARPWDRSEIAGILVQQVLPLVLPVSLQGQDATALKVRIGRPEATNQRPTVPPTWPKAVTAFLEHVVATVDPAAQVDLVSPEGPSRAVQGPDAIAVLVRTGDA